MEKASNKSSFFRSMHRRLNLKGKVMVAVSGVLGLIVLTFIIFLLLYMFNIGKVSENETLKEFVISDGDTYYSISQRLKAENLIKSEFFYKIYIKLNKPESLKSGKYELSQNMNVKEIIEIISKGGLKEGEMITFKEGLNMRQIAEIISKNTNNTIDDVYNVLQDEEYLNFLIEKYWFITDEIKNQEIYYSLEGYLFPDTYEFFTDEVTVREIFNTMIEEMNKKLEPYKADFANSKYTVHEILTLASIVELEGKSVNDRSEVAGVFYNRLNANWTLGSDVTTYYGAKVNMSERDLYVSEINDVNAYNTRSNSLAGKLPIGPICNPSLSSITASLYPKETDNYYFVADKNGKTYFTRTNAEHVAIISKLKSEGLWFTY